MLIDKQSSNLQHVPFELYRLRLKYLGPSSVQMIWSISPVS